MTREEFVKQRCELDKITEEEFEKTYRVVDCNCGALYCKGYRCLDLDDLLKENQELKKQLEETDRKLFLTKNELDMRQKTIDNKLNQQQEFINWLEAEIKSYEAISDLLFNHNKELKVYKEVLAKCKETIGGNKDE